MKFTAPAGATRISASCGGVSGAGTGSATLRNLPAGACTITAEVDGQSYQGSATVSAPGGFRCAVDGGGLLCR